MNKLIKRLSILALLTLAVPTHAEPITDEMLDIAMCIVATEATKQMARVTNVPLLVEVYAETKQKYVNLWASKYLGISVAPFLASYTRWMIREITMDADHVKIVSQIAQDCIDDAL